MTIRIKGFILALGLMAPVFALAADSPNPIYAGVGLNFTGSTYGVDSDARPPDPDGAVGPYHYVELINGRFSVFSRSTGSNQLTMSDVLFWGRAGLTIPRYWAVTDPRIFYETASKRWFACMVDYDPSGGVNTNRFLLAISATSDPTGAWQGVGIPSAPSGNLAADFPTLGFDACGVYLSANMFDTGGTSVGMTLVSVPKADLLAWPASADNGTWHGILGGSVRGQILQPAVVMDGTATGAILAACSIGDDGQPHSSLIGSYVQDPTNQGNATLSAPVPIPVPTFWKPEDPRQPDGSTNLDAGDARISAAVKCVNGVLYATQSTEVSNRAAIRWYRINASDFALLESGTIADPLLDLFYPSIAANSNGVVVIAFNGSSISNYVSAYALVGQTVDGVTRFGNRMLLKTGADSYQNNSGSESRWGDYSTTTVDPVDPSRFWTIQMIPNSWLVWSTQITQILTAKLELAITRQGTNVVLSWSSLATGAQLYESPQLDFANSWTTVSQQPTNHGGVASVTIPATDSMRFYRLQVSQ